MKLFPVTIVSLICKNLILYILTKYFIIGNIFVILADLSNLSFLFHQKFCLLSYDVKNVLTKQFSKMQKQSFPNVLQKCCSEVFCEKIVLRNFAKFAGKQLCQGLFINKVAGPSLILQLY